MFPAVFSDRRRDDKPIAPPMHGDDPLWRAFNALPQSCGDRILSLAGSGVAPSSDESPAAYRSALTALSRTRPYDALQYLYGAPRSAVRRAVTQVLPERSAAARSGGDMHDVYTAHIIAAAAHNAGISVSDAWTDARTDPVLLPSRAEFEHLARTLPAGPKFDAMFRVGHVAGALPSQIDFRRASLRVRLELLKRLPIVHSSQNVAHDAALYRLNFVRSIVDDLERPVGEASAADRAGRLALDETTRALTALVPHCTFANAAYPNAPGAEVRRRLEILINASASQVHASGPELANLGVAIFTDISYRDRVPAIGAALTQRPIGERLNVLWRTAKSHGYIDMRSFSALLASLRAEVGQMTPVEQALLQVFRRGVDAHLLPPPLGDFTAAVRQLSPKKAEDVAEATAIIVGRHFRHVWLHQAYNVRVHADRMLSVALAEPLDWLRTQVGSLALSGPTARRVVTDLLPMLASPATEITPFQPLLHTAATLPLHDRADPSTNDGMSFVRGLRVVCHALQGSDVDALDIHAAILVKYAFFLDTALTALAQAEVRTVHKAVSLFAADARGRQIPVFARTLLARFADADYPIAALLPHLIKRLDDVPLSPPEVEAIVAAACTRFEAEDALVGLARLAVSNRLSPMQHARVADELRQRSRGLSSATRDPLALAETRRLVSAPLSSCLPTLEDDLQHHVAAFLRPQEFREALAMSRGAAAPVVLQEAMLRGLARGITKNRAWIDWVKQCVSEHFAELNSPALPPLLRITNIDITLETLQAVAEIPDAHWYDQRVVGLTGALRLQPPPMNHRYLAAELLRFRHTIRNTEHLSTLWRLFAEDLNIAHTVDDAAYLQRYARLFTAALPDVPLSYRSAAAARGVALLQSHLTTTEQTTRLLNRVASLADDLTEDLQYQFVACAEPLLHCLSNTALAAVERLIVCNPLLTRYLDALRPSLMSLAFPGQLADEAAFAELMTHVDALRTLRARLPVRDRVLARGLAQAVSAAERRCGDAVRPLLEELAVGALTDEECALRAVTLARLLATLGPKAPPPTLAACVAQIGNARLRAVAAADIAAASDPAAVLRTFAELRTELAVVASPAELARFESLWRFRIAGAERPEPLVSFDDASLATQAPPAAVQPLTGTALRAVRPDHGDAVAFSRALTYLTHAANSGDPLAMLGLSELDRTGRYPEQQPGLRHSMPLAEVRASAAAVTLAEHGDPALTAAVEAEARRLGLTEPMPAPDAAYAFFLRQMLQQVPTGA